MFTKRERWARLNLVQRVFSFSTWQGGRQGDFWDKERPEAKTLLVKFPHKMEMKAVQSNGAQA